jgi:ABC-2 type transport system ATP-binding protein
VEIRNFIADLGKDKTVMLSTHIMQEVQAICDRVIIINKGRVVADDPTEIIQSQNVDAFQTIELEFDQVISANALKQVHGVVKVKKIDGKHFLLEGKPNRDIRSDIFQWAVKNKVTVLQLAKREKSLEEVFQELTK